MFRLLLLSILLLLPGGCALIPGGGKADMLYDLSPPQMPPSLRIARQMVIAQPVSGEALATDLIMTRRPGNEVAYVRGGRWAAPLPAMLVTRLTEGFENAGLARVFPEGSGGIAADYRLGISLRKFETEGGAAHVEFYARLVSDRDGRVLGGQLFSTSVPLHGSGAGASAMALDQAFGEAGGALGSWTARFLRQRVAPPAATFSSD